MESISKLSLNEMNECFNSDVDCDFLKKSQAPKLNNLFIPASSIRDLLITQMEVTFSPLKRSRIKHPKVGHERKNLVLLSCQGFLQQFQQHLGSDRSPPRAVDQGAKFFFKRDSRFLENVIITL